MVSAEVNAICAVGADGELVGILTDHDIIRALNDGGGSLGHARVRDWMSSNIIRCDIGTSLEKALKIMGSFRIRHIVILDGDRAVAVVGVREILHDLHRNDEIEKAVLRDMARAARIASA